MGRKRSTPKSSIGFFSVVALVIAAAAAGFWLTRTPTPLPHEQNKPNAPMPAVHLHGKKHRKVTIYVVKLTEDDAWLIPEVRSVPARAEPHEAAVEQLIGTNRGGGPSHYLIPAGTRLLGLNIKDRIAYADFSKEIKDNFSGGSMNEGLLVNSIVLTLTQFGDVDKVQILVEGNIIESLGGHVEISEPITGDSALLDKGEAE